MPAVTPEREPIERLVRGELHEPHRLLGAHLDGDQVTIRAWRPDATGVVALVGDERVALTEIHPAGLFEVVLARGDIPAYRLEVAYGDRTFTIDDPYRFWPSIGELDQHLLGEGRHQRLWQRLGAHEMLLDGVAGTAFAVWAPNARAVRVVGDFNSWDGRLHPMRALGSSGIWELFLPEVAAGARYKYELVTPSGALTLKADPVAFAAEEPPKTASVVYTSAYRWGDADWMADRERHDRVTEPMSTYEVHLGSWRHGLSYRELADQLPDYVADLGFTHVEFMPVAEHPYAPSWGYQVSAYYAPTARFGTPDDLRHLIDRLHQRGIGVLVDWVPAHFPKDAFALARFDGTALYEHEDPRRGEHPDWGSLVFNFGRNEVRNFLIANALYWLEEFHVDGLRVDAVASMLYLDYSRNEGEWVPNEYGGNEDLDAVGLLQEANATAYRRVPGVVTIAEESTSWPGVTKPTSGGGLGFGLKWNMGWMNDTLRSLTQEPIHRQYHHNLLTFSLMYAFTENFILPLSHDEVVHGKGSMLSKMPGDRWQKLANLRSLYAFMWAHPGKKLLFMGQEFAQEAEWSHERSLDWHLLEDAGNAGVQAVVRDLNRVLRAEPALWSQDAEPAGFEWIDANDAAGNVFSFLRWGSDGSVIVCVANFSAMPHESYRLGLPLAGRWAEIVNTDAGDYGGSRVRNPRGIETEDVARHGRPASVTLRLPPLGTLWLRPES